MPKCEHGLTSKECYVCASPKHGAKPERHFCERCGKRLSQDGIHTCTPPQQAEPVDVGLLEYRGNSVAFTYQKMTAYRSGIDAAWDALRVNGLHPDGKTSLADMIAKYTSPPQRKPLTEEEIDAVWDQWFGAYGLRGPGGPYTRRGFARAVERAHGITDPQIEDRLARHGIPMPGDPK